MVLFLDYWITIENTFWITKGENKGLLDYQGKKIWIIGFQGPPPPHEDPQLKRRTC